jgi:pyruvate dehydrogenase E1 component alpha subunit
VSTVAEFDIHHTAYLGPDGRPVRDLPRELADEEALVRLYRGMVMARTFDAKAIHLQRTGQLGTYPSLLGQEAVGVGVAHGMRSEDVLLPSFREHAVQLERGVKQEEIFLYWGGDERGSAFSGPVDDFPVGITVGGHAPQAAGVALAFKLRDEPRVAICVFGDGATSKGDVYEGMNAAGVWHLPAVFVVTNNQWAISTPRAEQTAAETLAQKAVAAGIGGEQVDGNDVIAVAKVVGDAIERARAGAPSLVECLTYRLGDHTTADDASRYRDDAEVSRWWQQDPVARLRLYLTGNLGWDKAREQALLDECSTEIDRAAEAYLNTPAQAATSMFDHLHAELPRALVSQRDQVSRSVVPEGDGND